jgi:Asp-tRNA(Asn)/Glu-tRNA(Gln) amidotransferase C subunit
MADNPLSPHILAAIAEKLAGLSLTPSDLEVLGAELETLLDDVRILDALDLGDVEPETLFDMQGP